MRHLKKGRKLGRRRNQRKALEKSLASSLFLFGKITTTEAKAKEIQPFIEKCITRGKKDTLANRRIFKGFFPDRARAALFRHGKTYQERSGGYTRITSLGKRKRDSARMAVLELVQ